MKMTIERMKELARMLDILPEPPTCPHCKEKIYRYIDQKSKCIHCGEYLFPKGVRKCDGRFPVENKK